MAEEIAFENGQISNFQGQLTLTLDQVMPHTVVLYSSTSTYMPNFIEIKETFCGLTLTFETHFIKSTQKSRPKKQRQNRLENASRPVHSLCFHLAKPDFEEWSEVLSCQLQHSHLTTTIQLSTTSTPTSPAQLVQPVHCDTL